MTTNYNPALISSWIISFAKIPEIVYFAQNVTLPSVSVDAIPVPFKNFRNPIPDNTIVWGDITISFIIDEEFINYDRLIKEFLLQEKATDGNANNHNELFSDMTVTRMSSNNRELSKFVLKNISLNSLGSINFNSNSTDPDSIFCDATFSVGRMEIVTNKGVLTNSS